MHSCLLYLALHLHFTLVGFLCGLKQVTRGRLKGPSKYFVSFLYLGGKGVFSNHKTIIALTLVGFEMVIANLTQ